MTYSRQFVDSICPEGFDRHGWRLLCWLAVQWVNRGGLDVTS